MADNGAELHGISWSRAFPFVRLFRTFRFAGQNAGRLFLGLLCICACYFTGRILDRIWPEDSRVLVRVDNGFEQTEIEAYASQNPAGFDHWKQTATEEYERSAERAQPAEGATPDDDLVRAKAIITSRLEAGLKVIDADADATDEEKEQQRSDLRLSADSLRLALAGIDNPRLPMRNVLTRDLDRVADADPAIEAAQRGDERALLRGSVLHQLSGAEVERRAPVGPFIALVDYESHCFAAAIQGVCAGRWGFSGSALEGEPTMLGSIASAGRGVMWLITQRPWYAIVCSIAYLLIFALFGGAIVRSAAVQSALDESISISAALGFAREKFVQFALAPVFPIGIFLGCAVLMFVLALMPGAIPVVGELFAGVFFGLALLVGFALALIALAMILGFNLLWPTIAVEGSDSFDAVSRAAGYVGTRPWYAGFYWFVLLLYGAVCFVMVRLIALLVFKLTHTIVAAGMSFFGAFGSAQTATFTKLDAMWHMPAWADLPLLPSTGDVRFWGTFFNAPLSGSESIGAILILIWVYLTVALVMAFVLNFFLCGSVEMYLLLRRHVDATDLDDVYYEKHEEEEAAEPEPETEAAPAEETASDAPESS